MTTNTNAASVAAEQAEALSVLISHAEGRISHDYGGRCPDGHNGPDSRAPKCPVCKALLACAALASSGAAPDALYSMDTDPQGIRALVADTIMGALAFGAQGNNPPPEGHWLTPFWEMARNERTSPGAVAAPAEADPDELQRTLERLDSKDLAAWADRGMALAENLAMYVQGTCPLRAGQARDTLRAHLFSAQPRPKAEVAAEPSLSVQAEHEARWQWARKNLLSATFQSGRHNSGATSLSPVGEANTDWYWDRVVDDLRAPSTQGVSHVRSE